MNVSPKSIKIIYWLATLSFWLSIVLMSQLRPETYTWRLATLQVMNYIVVAGLYFYVFKQFHNAIVAASSTYEPRFDSMLKTLLWGLFVRTASGTVGIGITALLLPLTPGDILVVSVFYAVIVALGFFNDGKRYDEFHNIQSV